jgi:hypothetical protein
LGSLVARQGFAAPLRALDPLCPDGKRIMPQQKKSGTGSKPLCKECPKVN